METGIHGILLKRAGLLLAGLITAWCAPANAAAPEGDGHDAVVEPRIERRAIHEPTIDAQDFEVGLYAGVISVEDFGSSAVYGVRGAYHVTEDFFVEATYGRTKVGKTSYETLSGAAQLLTDSERQFSYYDLSIGYNLFPGEAFIGRNHAFNTALYLVAGAGATRFADDSRFTFSFGGGYRFLATDWLALHADVRDHVFDSDLLGTNKTTHNIEVHAGATVFF